MQEPSMREALQHVATEGWDDEAQRHAQAALAALSDHRQPDRDAAAAGHSPAANVAAAAAAVAAGHVQKHVMMSYSWSSQPTVQRINEALLQRGYLTWLDVTDMTGSVVDVRLPDCLTSWLPLPLAASGCLWLLFTHTHTGACSCTQAMSDAVDNSAVMLSCISLSYKESANCRLEAQYGHQQEIPMLPLMMEENYKATGWLGLLLGTKIYFNFHPKAVETEELFVKAVDAVERDLGERGRPAAGEGGGGGGGGGGGSGSDGTVGADGTAAAAARVLEGVPPTPPTALAGRLWETEPAPAPSPIRAPAPAPAPAAAAAASFTPSLQLSSPGAAASSSSMAMALRSGGGEETTVSSSSLVELLLEQQRLMFEREEKIEAKAEAKQAELQLQMEQLRERLTLTLTSSPAQEAAAAISAEQITALQARLGKLHAAKLLQDEELYTLEDALADYAELAASTTFTMTIEVAHSSDAYAPARKLLKLVALSERLVPDDAFARQLARRKYV
jgi:hypothetical protein